MTSVKKFKRLPQHIGIIPDGNRRWAQSKGLEKQDGYKSGINPGLELYEVCKELNIKEMNEDSRISRSGSGGWYWVMRSRVVAVVKSLGVRGLESRR